MHVSSNDRCEATGDLADTHAHRLERRPDARRQRLVGLGKANSISAGSSTTPCAAAASKTLWMKPRPCRTIRSCQVISVRHLRRGNEGGPKALGRRRNERAIKAPWGFNKMQRRFTFREYAATRKKSFTDVGRFFERIRDDPDFLAINSRRDMEEYSERRAARFGERSMVRHIWRAYEQALRRAERAELRGKSR